MEMRRKDKLMAAAEVEDVLKDTEYGILGTYGENGYPYAVPVNYVYKDSRSYTRRIRILDDGFLS